MPKPKKRDGVFIIQWDSEYIPYSYTDGNPSESKMTYHKSKEFKTLKGACKFYQTQVKTANWRIDHPTSYGGIVPGTVRIWKMLCDGDWEEVEALCL